MTRPNAAPDKLANPSSMRTYVVDGKLTLSLRDAVVLTLENNSAVRVQETQIESSKFSLLGSARAVRSADHQHRTTSLAQSPRLSPSCRELAGTPSTSTSRTRRKKLQFKYSQTFETGTNVQTGPGHQSMTPRTFSLGFFNPYTTSALNFQFTQPLLRNGWLVANRAPLVIARRNLEQSRATFTAEVNDNILQASGNTGRWCRPHGNLEVARSSMEAAEATYKHDKRSLELGALPPLDIYRSESQVASRRVQVIQSEYDAEASRRHSALDDRCGPGSLFSGARSRANGESRA